MLAYGLIRVTTHANASAGASAPARAGKLEGGRRTEAMRDDMHRRNLECVAHRGELRRAGFRSQERGRQVGRRARAGEGDLDDASIADGEGLEIFHVVVPDARRADDQDWRHARLRLARGVAHDAVSHGALAPSELERHVDLVPLEVVGPRREALAAPRACRQWAAQADGRRRHAQMVDERAAAHGGGEAHLFLCFRRLRAPRDHRQRRSRCRKQTSTSSKTRALGPAAAPLSPQ